MRTGVGPRISACPVEARETALKVLYRRMPPALRVPLIARVLEEARCGDLDLSGLWVAWARSGRIAGALLTQPLAGKAAAVWAPEVRATWRRSAWAAGLVSAALEGLEARGFRLAQAVLDESADARAGADLARGGMPRVTELLYLERAIDAPLAERPPRDGRDFEWRPYEAGCADDFGKVLRATYADSRDMPELDGARGLDDILEGHRAAGLFAPERWRLGRVQGQPEAAAVLLLADAPARDAWEVVYLGLTPEARGRGLGRSAIRHALELARGQTARLELAVDQRNTPAVRLYEGAGFSLRDRRTVHLAVLGRSSFNGPRDCRPDAPPEGGESREATPPGPR